MLGKGAGVMRHILNMNTIIYGGSNIIDLSKPYNEPWDWNGKSQGFYTISSVINNPNGGGFITTNYEFGYSGGVTINTQYSKSHII